MKQIFLRTSISLMLAGLISTPVLADNIAESESTGDHNVSTITQTGDNQDGKVTQTGDRLTSTITQIDFGNKSTVKQAGENNISTITQELGNTATVDQGGKHLLSTINQDQDTNDLGRTTSKNNFADVVQRGAWNISTVNQFDSNHVEVSQTGTGTRDNPNVVLINQFKNEDLAIAGQTGGAGNSIEINQTTCCGGTTSDVKNKATAIQNGSFNTTRINQRALEIGND